MRILALETSGKTGSVAALAAGQVVAETALDPVARNARTLAPTIKQTLATVGWKPRDVELVAVAIGPGSFTGLRLGVMTAKAFTYGVGAAVQGVGTLAAIASRLPQTTAEVAVAIDAQRGELYVGRFRATESGEVESIEDAKISPIDSWLAELPAGTMVTGPALEKLASRLPEQVLAAPREAWHPTATSVGQLAARLYAAGVRDDLWTLAPLYLRRAAAEEKWDSKNALTPVL